MKPVMVQLLEEDLYHQVRHVRAALAIARMHRDESVAWDDVCLLLEAMTLAD